MDPIEIYKDLKDKIVWLDIAPESAMNLVELAQSYGVSRNPITIALNRLEVEEWVVRQGSHFVVSPLTLDRIREITEIRSVLEVQAIIWAMHRASPDQIKEFRKILKEIENVNRTAVNRQLVELDVRFHRLIYKCCQNNQLTILLDRMLSHYLRFWLSLPQPIDKDDFFLETKEILTAIEQKEEVRLRAASIKHIKASLDVILGFGRS